MGIKIFQDCSKCGNRFEWDTDNGEVRKCDRCLLLEGSDIPEMLKELRKNKIPGQEPILRMIEVLNENIQKKGKELEELITGL
jgi:disulfide oxidoreductase YuzD